jgi:hypothetical protein
MGVLGEKPVPTQFPERAKVEILRERCLGTGRRRRVAGGTKPEKRVGDLADHLLVPKAALDHARGR